jgi:hypothetical protein
LVRLQHRQLLLLREADLLPSEVEVAELSPSGTLRGIPLNDAPE